MPLLLFLAYNRPTLFFLGELVFGGNFYLLWGLCIGRDYYWALHVFFFFLYIARRKIRTRDFLCGCMGVSRKICNHSCNKCSVYFLRRVVLHCARVFLVSIQRVETSPACTFISFN